MTDSIGCKPCPENISPTGCSISARHTEGHWHDQQGRRHARGVVADRGNDHLQLRASHIQVTPGGRTSPPRVGHIFSYFTARSAGPAARIAQSSRCARHPASPPSSHGGVIFRRKYRHHLVEADRWAVPLDDSWVRNRGNPLPLPPMWGIIVAWKLMYPLQRSFLPNLRLDSH